LTIFDTLNDQIYEVINWFSQMS